MLYNFNDLRFDYYMYSFISVMSSNELDFSKELRQTLIYGGYLHDVGKINTNKEVLLKTRKIEWWGMERAEVPSSSGG